MKSLETHDDKGRDEVDLQLVMAELKGLLQITSVAFGVASNDGTVGQSLNIFDETPDEAADFQLGLQEMLLKKMNDLETSMVQMEGHLSKDSIDAKWDHPSLFGPT